LYYGKIISRYKKQLDEIVEDLIKPALCMNIVLSTPEQAELAINYIINELYLFEPNDYVNN
jgi:hypothetical protein